MRFLTYFILSLTLIALGACKKDPKSSSGAYHTTCSLSDKEVNELSTFQGLHSQIFAPTCANSGCHDGTFEPDFRTVESAYNSLVYQPVIKNDASSSYSYRVTPGSPGTSVLYCRLTTDIDGISGVMPLVVEPNSCYPSRKSAYIDAVRKWIQEGAKDIFGNPPKQGNKEPECLGLQAFLPGQTQPLFRKPSGQIRVPQGTQNLELWFALNDDDVLAEQLQVCEIKTSRDYQNFPATIAGTFKAQATPKKLTGFSGQQIDFGHKGSVDVSMFPVNTAVFLRIYVKDIENPTTEIPRDGAAYYFVLYMSLIIE